MKFTIKKTTPDNVKSEKVSGLPKKATKIGLYDPKNEHDACGLGFIANFKGKKSHKIIQDGIKILENLEHRGATGADPLMGDGAGMLTQIPHRFFSEECQKIGFKIPNSGQYSIGFFFTPRDQKLQNFIKMEIEKIAAISKQPLIGWRAVPTDNSMLSQDPDILNSEPMHWQGFLHGQKIYLTTNLKDKSIFYDEQFQTLFET